MYRITFHARSSFAFLNYTPFPITLSVSSCKSRIDSSNTVTLESVPDANMTLIRFNGDYQILFVRYLLQNIRTCIIYNIIVEYLIFYFGNRRGRSLTFGNGIELKVFRVKFFRCAFQYCTPTYKYNLIYIYTEKIYLVRQKYTYFARRIKTHPNVENPT